MSTRWDQRIAELEAKLGLHEPPPLIFKIHFISGESHEAESALLMERGVENRWFEREDGESEAEFLDRVDQQQDDIDQPKETQP